MKKTFNINISGRIFTIDEDAYFLLKDYLDTLSHAFNRGGNEEIVVDIEGRISEIFAERNSYDSIVITINDVNEVITRIGRPEELLEEEIDIVDSSSEEEIKVKETVTPPPYPLPEVKIQKKLYRDSSKGIIGGVCAGLAAYFGMDVTWVRLIMIALCFLSLSTISIIYIILWIVLPDAQTPIQKLEMTGESPTLFNIGENVKSFYNTNSVAGKNDGEKQGGFLKGFTHFWGIIGKVLIFIVAIILIPVLLSLIVGFIGCIVALIAFIVACCWNFQEFVGITPGEYEITIIALICGIGYILLIGIPIFILIYTILSSNNSKPRNLRKSTKLTLLVTWIVGFLMAAVSTGLLIVKNNEDSLINDSYDSIVMISHYSFNQITTTIELDNTVDNDIVIEVL